MDKPQALVGIKIRDFTDEQRQLYWRWQWAKHGSKEVERRKTNPETIKKRRAYYRKYKQERSARDPQFALINRLRSRLSSAIAKGVVTESIAKLLGCSWNHFRDYLSLQFATGMNWENYGNHWHIDHKKPVALFNQLDPNQLAECWHYSNLRPRLAAIDQSDTRTVR